MRTRIIASLCLLLGAGQALAQEEDVGQEEEQEQPAGETEGSEVVNQGDQVRMAPQAGGEARPSAPGQVHTVVPGDTLWDLSQSYLGSPWYWPKVWSYNPEIANPHWIYPGNRIRFYPSGEEVPSQVEVSGAPGQMPEEGELEAPTAFEEDTGSVSAAGKIGYTPGRQARLLLQGFVTARELEEAGAIAGSFAETDMLSYPDTVYIRFKNRGNAKLGESYVVFKTVKDVRHPINGAKVGFLTHFLGKVRVVRISDETVTAQITDTWDEIHRGDLIGPANEDLRLAVAPRPNDKELAGFIVELMVPYLTMAGEHQLVLLDRGSSDGVQVGNTFQVVRQQDMGGRNLMEPQKSQDKKWPAEKIAACMVVDVKDKASTCLMTRSIREVLRGDRVVMQAEVQPTASR